MKNQEIKNFFFIIAVLMFAPVNASAQLLKPGEIIYGRTQSETNGACTTAAIWAVGQDGSNDRFITFGRQPRISPDGRKILFKRWASNVTCTSGFEGFFNWFIRDLATGVETQIGGQSGGSTGAFFTPETNRAGLQITASESGTMCQLNISGGRTCYQLQIEPIRGFGHPSVRGGDFLIVAENYDDFPVDVGGLYTMNYDRTNIRKIPNTAYIDESPSWSNDGQTIAYAVYATQCCRTPPYYFLNLFKIKPDGTNKTQLTNVTVPPGSGFAYGLVWSQDNSIIYNAAKLNNITGIYKIDANGGGILGRVPTTPGQPIEWVGGIMPPFEEKEVAAWGGGVATNSNFTLVNTVGQSFAGQISAGGSYNLQSGFWTFDAARRTPFDYDGDGKSDISVFRPSTGAWFVSQSSNNTFFGTTFGQNGDLIAPSDFDGDGRTDVSVFRGGNWYRFNSSNNSFAAVSFGIAGDLPVPADFDGDGKADISVYRASTGNWYRLNSSDNSFTGISFGTSQDKPQIGDFDGDGKSDICVFRPSTGSWYRLNSSNGQFLAVNFGISTDLTVPSDYDGDGKTDIGVYRQGNWYRLNSSDNSFTGVSFGNESDKPVPADFDGDGKADISVFRPSDGSWYLLRSTAGFTAQSFGTSGDIPTPNAFINFAQ